MPAKFSANWNPINPYNSSMDTTMSAPQIRVGVVYRYTAGIPVGCAGHRYRVLDFVQHVPSYQEHVLVEALTGPDRDKRFTWSPWNFSYRYEPIQEEQG